jgi:hypothetical protein
LGAGATNANGDPAHEADRVGSAKAILGSFGSGDLTWLNKREVGANVGPTAGRLMRLMRRTSAARQASRRQGGFRPESAPAGASAPAMGAAQSDRRSRGDTHDRR